MKAVSLVLRMADLRVVQSADKLGRLWDEKSVRKSLEWMRAQRLVLHLVPPME